MKKLAVLAGTLLFPFFAYASLININTADAALLDTLPGIGPVKAAAIVDYRTQNGPFVHIEDIQNVSGIGPSTFADIAPFITVSDDGASDPAPTSTDQVATSTPSASQSPTPQAPIGASGTPEYVPIPVLRLTTGGDRTVAAGADTPFIATVYDTAGHKRADALVTWSFGDGMQRTGASVFHDFYESGEYDVFVQATTDDGGDATAEFVVTAKAAGIAIASVSSHGITLVNSDKNPLDISYWRLTASGGEFKFPPHTQILGKHTVVFAPQVTNLAAVGSATLLYPDGTIAAVYPASLPARPDDSGRSGGQPLSAPVSYQSVQKVEPVKSSLSPSAYDTQAAIAPAATTTVAAAGAALRSTASSSSPLAGAFRSPWTLGFAGIVVFSAAALLLL